MLYKKPSFSVPATEGKGTLCESSGQHAMPDTRGKCIRCGDLIDAPKVEAEKWNSEGWISEGGGWEYKDIGNHSRGHRASFVGRNAR